MKMLSLLFFSSISLAICGEPPNPWYCPLNPLPLVALDGDYKVEFKVGSRVFIDHLQFRGTNGFVDATTRRQNPIVGTFQVPGVFTSAVKGSVDCLMKQIRTCQLRFTITAEESGVSYQVHFDGTIPSELYKKLGKPGVEAHFSGFATTDSGQVLATFHAIRKGP